MTVQDQSNETPDDAPVPMHEGRKLTLDLVQKRGERHRLSTQYCATGEKTSNISGAASLDLTLQFNVLPVFYAFCIIMQHSWSAA